MATYNSESKSSGKVETCILKHEESKSKLMEDEAFKKKTDEMSEGCFESGSVSESGSKDVVKVELSKNKYPQSAKHIQDAIAKGHPDVLTIDRGGAKERRKASLKGVPTISGLDRDEYPPAMSKEGGKGASVRHIGQSDNRGSGSILSQQLREYPDGTKYKIVIIEGDE